MSLCFVGVETLGQCFCPSRLRQQSENSKGHGRHHFRFVQGVVLASAARRLVGVGRETRPTAQCRGPIGHPKMRVHLIRDGDHSAIGIAPTRYQTGVR